MYLQIFSNLISAKKMLTRMMVRKVKARNLEQKDISCI